MLLIQEETWQTCCVVSLPNEVVLRLSFYIFFLMFHYLEAQIFV